MVLVLDLVAFTLRALGDWHRLGSLRRRIGSSPLVPQIIYGAIDALPVITLLGLATGFVVSYRLIALFDVVGTEFVINVLVDLVGMEVGPLITAIILVSRTGSAITVELANMKLHGEVESLEILGVDLNHYAVGPRMVGTALAQLGLAVYFTVLALCGGIVLASLLISTTYIDHLVSLAGAFTPLALLGFTLKNLSFGLLVGATACFQGLRVEQSPTEVPQRLQAAIVTSLVLVFLIDGLFAMVL